MSTLPPTGSFLAGAGSRITRGALFEDWLGWARQQAGGADYEGLSISGGAITPSRGFVIVDTEGGAAGDDLDRINPANFQAGHCLFVKALDPGRPVRLRQGQGGVGQLGLATTELVLSSFYMGVWLKYSGSQWNELSRVYGDQVGAARSYLGLTDVAIAQAASAEDVRARSATNRALMASSIYQMFEWYWGVIGDRVESTTFSRDGELVYSEIVDGAPVLRRIATAKFLSKSFSEHYYSGELTCAAGDTGTLTHSFANRPSMWRATLLCKTAELGWSVGDELSVDNSVTGSTNRGLTVAVNATSIKYKFAATNPIAVNHYSTGVWTAVTPGNWRCVIRAWA